MNQSVSFLRRWSRLKLQQPQAKSAAPSAAAQPLPPLDTLDFDSDFSAFLQPHVDPATRSQALRRLFMTDHYRAMDGLDVYVEDYSCPAALPAAVLATLDHAQSLLAPPQEPAADPTPEPPEQA